jgi:hypothetical protein
MTSLALSGPNFLQGPVIAASVEGGRLVGTAGSKTARVEDGHLIEALGPSQPVCRTSESWRVSCSAENLPGSASDDQRQLPCPRPRCGGRMIIIETFTAGAQPTSLSAPMPIRIDTA